MDPFNPLFGNPHVQTIAGHLWSRGGLERRFPLDRRFYPTEPGVECLVESQLPAAPPRGHLVLVHGLEGSGRAGYMRSLAAAALRRGYAAHRFHMRSCGGTESHSSTLYHGGLTADLRAVLAGIRQAGREPVFAVGFSLGGNVVLKLAGELGEAGPTLLDGAAAVSTPLDLAACAGRLAQPENRLYERRFVRRMRARLLATGRYPAAELAGLRGVRQIDDRITAPAFGFGDAQNYYRTQSSIGYLAGIRIPALLIQAEDDPLVPFDLYRSSAVRRNPRLHLVATAHGGHLGFLGRRPHRFWADEAIMEWVSAQSVKNGPVGASLS